MHPVSCTNSLHDVTDFANCGMVFENERGTYISGEMKKFLTCASQYVLKFFCIVADVTLNSFDLRWFGIQVLKQILV